MPGSSITPILNNPVSPYFFSGLTVSSYNTTTNSINLGTTHNFSTRDPIWLISDGSAGTSQTGGIARQRYFVIAVDLTTIKLATTPENASSGTALTLTTPTSYGASSSMFAKLLSTAVGQSTPLTSASTAYTKSNIIFNSSTPVEISFTVPGFTPVTTTEHSPLFCLLKNSTSENYWGTVINVINSNNRLCFFDNNNILASQASSITSYTSSGYTQRYVITPSRTIEYWTGTTLFYTSLTIQPNTPLILEFGTNLNLCKLQNCTIKYL